ncbi:hypothetical protein QQZ08_007519 [Neonectria magnoliae]|uniref:Uncharacterized protein n=1 Tax=Neonectria magnoliae TaxID=2732573 RepID=A0ABR1HXJ3_9HYPO
MAPQRGRPKKPLTHEFLKGVKVLPDIPTLCRQLGYEVSDQPRHETFLAAVSAQAENIIPPGSKDQFLKWRNPVHRRWLMTGTASFLDKDGRGGLYWPDNPLAENYGKLQYRKDRFPIQRAMVQLLFQIDQSFKNGYKSVTSSQCTHQPARDDTSAAVPNGTIVQPLEIENAHHQREGTVENPTDVEMWTPSAPPVSPLGQMRRLSLNTLSDVPGRLPNLEASGTEIPAPTNSLILSALALTFKTLDSTMLTISRTKADQNGLLGPHTENNTVLL